MTGRNSDANSLAGRVALVTGATSGIGLGIATALAANGMHVMITGLGTQAEIDAAVQTVHDVGDGDTRFAPADLRDPSEIDGLFDVLKREFGGIDVLVNNAGIQFVSPVQDFPPQKWNDILAVNLSSVFHTIRLATPIMLQRGGGRIVNIASAHALVASPFKSAYVAAKHGVAGLTKTVALELAEQGVTVNAIAPGYVDTPLVRKQVAATAQARGISENEVINDVMLAAQPTKRFITIDQVADLVVYLCRDATASITGSVLPIDGGWSAR